jgi:hypothetical protein
MIVVNSDQVRPTPRVHPWRRLYWAGAFHD